VNKNKSIQLLLAAAMALPLVAGAAESMAPEGGHPAFGGRHHPLRDGELRGNRPGLHFLRGLDLSESQEEKLFQLMHAQAPYVHEQQVAHDKAMRALHEMEREGKFDDAAATRLAQAAAQAQANLTLSRIRTHQKVLALLTPEQRKQLDERKARLQRGGSHER
jgi:periplasmic protein CpxP/Spy